MIIKNCWSWLKIANFTIFQRQQLPEEMTSILSF